MHRSWLHFFDVRCLRYLHPWFAPTTYGWTALPTYVFLLSFSSGINSVNIVLTRQFSSFAFDFVTLDPFVDDLDYSSPSWDQEVSLSANDLLFGCPTQLPPPVAFSQRTLNDGSSMETTSDDCISDETDENRDSENEQDEPVEKQQSLRGKLNSLSLLIHSHNQGTAIVTPRPFLKRKRNSGLEEDELPAMKRSKTDATKKFPCDLCEKSYCRKGDLGRHKKVCHQKGVPAHPCDKCEQVFSLRGNLARHQRTVHGPRSFQCKVCNKSFTQQSDVERHEVIHTGMRPYQCNVCERQFVQKAHLNYHIKSKHTKL